MFFELLILISLWVFEAERQYLTPLIMKGQARNVWKGTQTTKQHFFRYSFLFKLFLTYFRKYHAAYRNFFPLFVWIFNPYRIIQIYCVWREKEEERRKANLKQWVPAHAPTHGLASTSCVSISHITAREVKTKRRKPFNVIGLFVLKLYLLEAK